MKKAIAVVFCLIFAFSAASAHSGRTDANGGHWDRSTGEYHYHHGYPAHQHPGGVCPYNYNDLTGSSSGSSSGSTSSGSGSGSVAAAAAESNSAEDSSIEYKYNNGAGDDGTYETAYNLGYQHGMEAAAPYDSGYPDNIFAAATYFCHTKALTGSTSYADSGSSYDQAYEDGYLAATADMEEYIGIIYPEGIPADAEETSTGTEETSSLEYPYDRDDGTYETAYNAGYTHGCALLIELNAELLPDVRELTGQLSASNRIEGNTPLESHSATFESAYEDGFYQSEEDFYNSLNNLILQSVPVSDLVQSVPKSPYFVIAIAILSSVVVLSVIIIAIIYHFMNKQNKELRFKLNKQNQVIEYILKCQKENPYHIPTTEELQKILRKL